MDHRPGQLFWAEENPHQPHSAVSWGAGWALRMEVTELRFREGSFLLTMQTVLGSGRVRVREGEG